MSEVKMYKAQEIIGPDDISIIVKPPAHFQVYLKADYDKAAGSQAAYNIERLNLDCGDSSCRYAKNKTGVRTNGGCRCKEKIHEGKSAIDLLNVWEEGLAITCNDLGWDNSNCYDFTDLLKLIKNNVEQEREEREEISKHYLMRGGHSKECPMCPTELHPLVISEPHTNYGVTVECKFYKCPECNSTWLSGRQEHEVDHKIMKALEEKVNTLVLQLKSQNQPVL